MPYVIDVVEGEHRAVLYAENYDKMIQIGVWLTQRAEVTGLEASIHTIDSQHTDVDLDDMEFTDHLINQFQEFRAHLH